MSRTSDPGKRNASDFYPTPQEYADRIFREINTWGNIVGPVLEPGCGLAPFCKSAKKFLDVKTIGVELRPDAEKQDWTDKWYNADFRSWNPPKRPGLIITNPPFSIAKDFLDRSLRMVADDGYIVFLLRSAWLESDDRTAFHQSIMPWRVYFIPDRPSFTGKGTDATMYSYFVYRPSWKEKHFEGRMLYSSDALSKKWHKKLWGEGDGSGDTNHQSASISC